LTQFSNKRHRGRPRKIEPSWVIGRAENYRTTLKGVWKKLSESLMTADTEALVTKAFEDHGQPYAQEFVPRLAGDILMLVQGADFPKRRLAQIAFIADSLGGRPNISFRSSRDICGRERAKQRAKSQYKILRKEFYVECSCGYKGPARDDACRKCGAEIPVSISELFNVPR
jgi:hypothetical protein